MTDWLVLRAHQLSHTSWEVTLYNEHVEHKHGTGRSFDEAHTAAMESEPFSAEWSPPPLAETVDLRSLVFQPAPAPTFRRR